VNFDGVLTAFDLSVNAGDYATASPLAYDTPAAMPNPMPPASDAPNDYMMELNFNPDLEGFYAFL